MSRQKLRSTKEDVVARIQQHNPDIDMIGEYLGSHRETMFVCRKGHEWLAPPHRLLSFHRGCPQCRVDPRKLTKESVNQHLSNDNRGIRLIGDYVSNNTKALFRCSNDHEWMALPRTIMYAAGCPHCAVWSREEINDRMRDAERDVVMIDECVSLHTRATFCCSSGHKWETAPNNVLNGTGCPSCAQYGFDINASAYSYVLLFDDFIKYGITNNLNTRLAQHRSVGDFTLVETQQHSTGREALDWELKIKRTHGGNYISRDRMPNGFTETLPTKKLNELIQTA